MEELMPSYEALGPVFHNALIPQFVAARKDKNISQLEMDEILGVAKGWLFCCWADALGMQITLTPKVQNNDNKS